MIWARCEKDCPEKNHFSCRGEERAFELIERIGDAPGEEIYVVMCGNCGHHMDLLEEEWLAAGKEMDRRAGRVRANLTRYPRIEPHTGELVKSRHHEMEVVKRAGYHVAEHGINEKYDDEVSQQLKDKRLAMEERRRAIRKKRETLIREGVIKKPRHPHASGL